MKQIKLIALDLDKTLINSDMVIPKENITAIQNASNAGCHVVIVSGRCPSSVKQYMKILSLKTVIPSLGGCLIEEWNGKIIQDYTISIEDSVDIYSIIRETGLFPIVFKLGDWFSDPENEYWIQREYAATHLDGIIEDMGNYLATHRPNKILLPSTDSKLLERVKDEINCRFQGRVLSFLSSPYYLEIMPYGVNKGTAINNLMDYFKVQKDEVLAIGDFYNDIDMFKASGHSATPSNAPDDIKQMVEYVSPLNHNQSAVAEIIGKYLDLR